MIQLILKHASASRLPDQVKRAAELHRNAVKPLLV
jgi:hypothetical protein